MSSPNENCLKGKRCPACKSYDSFSVSGQACFTLFDDGTDSHGDIEFNNDGFAECLECHHKGSWGTFDENGLPTLVEAIREYRKNHDHADGCICSPCTYQDENINAALTRAEGIKP